jgi:hypothetical protein
MKKLPKWHRLIIAISVLAVSGMMVYEGIMRVINS